VLTLPIISDEFIIFQLSQGYVVDIANISTEICSVYDQHLCLLRDWVSTQLSRFGWIDSDSRPTGACAVTH
jgi:hypothetical protein